MLRGLSIGTVLVVALVSPCWGDTEVDGDVNGEWNTDGSPYIVTGDLRVPDGDQLTIDPGVSVLFDGEFEFLINGLLTAVGDTDHFITFDLHNGADAWRSIRLMSATDGCQISYCIIAHAELIAEYNEVASRGGAIFAQSCDNLLISHCDISSARSLGQGTVTLYSCTGEFSDNYIHDNLSFTEIVWLESSDVSILSNLVENNRSTHGAGIIVEQASPEVCDNVVRNNTSTTMRWGCGLYFIASRSRVYNNLVYDNDGGGVYVGSGSNLEEFDHNVIFHNPGRCGLILVDGNVTMTNSVLWNHDVPIWNAGGGVSASYSDIQDFANQGVEAGDGMIDNDPEFRDPGNDDFTLSDQSPCADAGDPDSPEDPDGSVTDIGLYFASPPTKILVSPDSLAFGYLVYDHPSFASIYITAQSEAENPPEVELAFAVERGGAWLSLDREDAVLAAGDTIALNVKALAYSGSALGDRRGVIQVSDLAREDRVWIVPVSGFVVEGFGAIKGRVTDAGTGQGIPDVTVSLDGYPRPVVTGDWGEFSISKLPAWAYTATVHLPDFQPFSAKVDVNAGQTLSLPIRLRYAECDVDPEQLTVDLPPDTELTQEVRLINAGTGDLHFQIARRFPSYDDSAAWREMLKVEAGQLTGDDRIYGIEFAGDKFYVTGGNNGAGVGKIYQFSREGEYLDSYDQIGQSNWGMRDLAWDGELLWGSSGETIYGFTPDGELRTQFLGPLEINRCLTWDAKNDLLWVTDAGADFYGITREGNVVHQFGNDQDLQVFGLATFPADPDNCTIYAFCRGALTLKIYKMNPAVGDWKFVRDLIPAQGGLLPGGATITHDWNDRSWVLAGVLQGTAEFGDEFGLWQIPTMTSVTPWSERSTIDATGICSDSLLHGVEFDGENFYVTGSGPNDDRHLKVYVLSKEGELFRSFDQPGESRDGMYDLAWDGYLLWGADHQRIYGFNTEGELEESFRGPLAIQMAIAFDRERDALWVCDRRSDLYAIDFDGLVLDTIETHRPMDITGLATDPDDPDGYTLYVLGREGVSCEAWKINPDTKDWSLAATLDTDDERYPGGVTITSQCAPLATIMAAILESPDLADPDNLALYQVRTRTDWVTVPVASGRLQAHGTASIPVVFNSFGIPAKTDLEAELLITHDGRGESYSVPVYFRTLAPVDAPEDRPLTAPAEFALFVPQPNPFNSTVQISFSVPRPAPLTVALYDLSGRRVAVLVNDPQSPGVHTVSWTANDAPTGIYFVRMAAPNYTKAQRVVLIK